MSAPILGAHLRIARPTDNISALRGFYIDGLGFNVVGSFTDHEDFDGLILGFESAPYHLEFVQKHGHTVGKAPTEDNLLVFYLPDSAIWQAAVDRMKRAGYENVKAFNPYWDARGVTFEDADGYRIVLQNAEWVNRVRDE